MNANHTTTTVPSSSVPLSSMSDVLSNEKFTRYLLFNFLFIGSSFLPSVFITNYGARWFSGCNPNTSDICYGIEYSKLNFYQSLSTSMRGCIAFFFAGFIGRLSDAYGRKMFLFLHPILYSLQILPLIIASNFLWYLLLTPCAGLVGASLGLTPMMSAYISDVLPPTQRTLGFAISYGSAGAALLLSSIISLMVSLYMSDYINFWLILVLYVAQMFYIWFCIPESLQDKYIKPLNKKHVLNPLRPLLQITNNRIVFWISMVQFLITFMEVGILNICMVYILTELQITDSDANYLLMFTFTISVSFGLFIATVGIIPLSRRYALDCCWCRRYKPIIVADAPHTSHAHAHIQRNIQHPNNTARRLSCMSLTELSQISEMSTKPQPPPQAPPAQTHVNDVISTSEHRLFPYWENNRMKAKKYHLSKSSLLAGVRDVDNENNGDDDGMTTTTREEEEILVATPYIMPRRAWIDYNNLFIGVCLSFVSLLCIGCVAWIHSPVYIGLSGMSVGCAVGVTFPSANGVATTSLRNDEQGKGFGIIYAVKGITSSIAPFAFGMFYTYLVEVDRGPIIFLIGMLLTLLALIVIVWPLRWVLCDQQGYKRKQCLLTNQHYGAGHSYNSHNCNIST
eukprot:CAMPEP_0202734198 /NCGR_PEP_ID=MMETSP1385-20130828/188554_1 /ASSEMBLY_ACC=CAM_ASM_000861 /TAXON_ID=933848 /ORGANISM="Elphidium margaritaceum" /LENGTH=623 /DNA_ID=CAMNT_0049400545 /DNA_START=1 /DNA_END=1872 /DNA_ORIENTATION=-